MVSAAKNEAEESIIARFRANRRTLHTRSDDQAELAENRGHSMRSIELDPQVIEISTDGYDEALQSVGSDPFGSASRVGLRVPTLATQLLVAENQSAKDSRYLMMLAAFSISHGVRAKILGYRQMVKIGYQQARNGDEGGSAPYVVEQLVTDPSWSFQDGNVSFHLQALGPPNNQGFNWNDQGPTDLQNFKYQFSMTPSVLYQTATVPNPMYVNLTAYQPPNNGRPWGTPLRSGGQSTFHDLRTEWKTHGAWSALGLEVEGPDTIALFASVRQTNPISRDKLVLPGTVYPSGLPAEEAFLQNFPNAIYWRVAGSLIVRIG